MVTKIVGILNVTPDSFSDGGKFTSLDHAINHLKEMLEEGADVIDIGAESTRPQATPITDAEEWSRLEKILPAVISEVKKFNKNSGKKVLTSIDSYHFATIKKAYEAGVDIINDVSGLSDEKIVKFIAEKNITTILMHCSQVPPVENAVINPYMNLNGEIIKWAKRKVRDLEKKGVKKSQLIFDPGIGFKKNAEQSVRILKFIHLYREIGLPLYIGHSKKSFLDAVKIPGDKAQKTLEISKHLIKKGVEFLRVHDVKDHKKLII